MVSVVFLNSEPSWPLSRMVSSQFPSLMRRMDPGYWPVSIVHDTHCSVTLFHLFVDTCRVASSHCESTDLHCSSHTASSDSGRRIHLPPASSSLKFSLHSSRGFSSHFRPFPSPRDLHSSFFCSLHWYILVSGHQISEMLFFCCFPLCLIPEVSVILI